MNFEFDGIYYSFWRGDVFYRDKRVNVSGLRVASIFGARMGEGEGGGGKDRVGRRGQLFSALFVDDY